MDMALFTFLSELFSIISDLLLHISCKIGNFKNILILYGVADLGAIPVLVFIVLRYISAARVCSAIEHYYDRCIVDGEDEDCDNSAKGICSKYRTFSITWITFISFEIILRVFSQSKLGSGYIFSRKSISKSFKAT